MIIAIPISNGKLDPHFGHCKAFSLIKVDVENKAILSQENLDAPLHVPGLLPVWLAEHSVGIVIVGGIGQRAKELMVDKGIKVLVGASQETPEKIALGYLHGTLELGINCCDH